MDKLFQDLRYAVKLLRKQQLYSIIVITVLTLGISGTTIMFTTLYSVILRPLPFKDAERIVMLVGAAAPPTGDLVEWWKQTGAFSDLCEYWYGGVNIGKAASVERVTGASISQGFFGVFSISPQKGRVFTEQEENSGDKVVIISNRIWAQIFSSHPDIIGQQLLVDGISYIVIGVMPFSFSHPNNSDLWFPRPRSGNLLSFGESENIQQPAPLRQQLVGRLNKEVSLAQARERLRSLFAELHQISERRSIRPGDGVRVFPMQEFLIGKYKPSFWILLSGVIILLSIACANAANLIAIRTAVRKSEFATRLCLGASRLRIARQLLTEIILICGFSGIASLVLTFWGLRLVRIIAPPDTPRISDLEMNMETLVFVFVLCVLVTFVISLYPLSHILVVRPANIFNKDVVVQESLLVLARKAFVVFEIALALMLVSGAFLTAKSLHELSKILPGVNPTGVVTMRLSLPPLQYAGQEKRTDANVNNYARVYDTYHLLLSKIRNINGVYSVGAVSRLPMDTSVSSSSLWADITADRGGLAQYSYVLGSYFSTMGIQLLRGREFQDSDREASPKVVIVNELFAEQYWPTENPIGQVLIIAGERYQREVIGVVRNVHDTGIDKSFSPHIYLPYQQPYQLQQPPLEMVLVTRLADMAAIKRIRQTIASVDKNVPIFRIRPMSDILASSISAYRFRGILMSMFAVLALILSMSGVYGVVAYSIVSHTTEIGIRVCLGATPYDIVCSILREYAIIILIAISTGLLGALWLNNLMLSLLFGVQTQDVTIHILASVSIAICAIAATFFPALAASRLSPATALRHH
ncbi:MAG: ABC transporter permease [Acidobacteria bacterium]|nr:ABC transporter permease [Acidobacteriota bacterium]